MATQLTAVDTLSELRKRGYALSVRTEVETFRVMGQDHRITMVAGLKVKGPEEPPVYLSDAIGAHTDALMAAAAVLSPPYALPALAELVRRHTTREVFVSERTDPAGDPLRYRIDLQVLCANLAGFLGLDTVRDGPTLEPVVEAALSQQQEAA